MSEQIVIVGGGLAGMCAAYEAVSRGWHPVVIETRGRPGGLIASACLADVTFDIGAESWATRSHAVRELVDELGLDVTEPTGRSWVHNQHTGQSYPIPEGSLGIPASLDAPEVRTALGEDGWRRACEDLTMGSTVGTDATDLGSLVEQRLGTAALDHLVRPVAGGIHTCDPSQLAVDAVIPGIREAMVRHGSLIRAAAELAASNPGAKVAQTSGGMFRLIEALRARVESGGGRILARHAVMGIRPDSNGTWSITIQETQRPSDPAADPEPTGEPWEMVSERVVVALPGRAAMPLLHEAVGTPTWDLPLGTPIAHQVLVVDCADLDAAPRGSGVLVTAGRDNDPGAVQAKAVSHLSHKWGWMRQQLPPHRHVLRVSYGRMGEPYPQPSVERAVSDVSRVCGVNLTAENVVASMLVRWDGQLAPQTPEHRERVAAFCTEVSRHRGLQVTGAWVAGSGFAAVVPHARRCVKALS